MKILITTPSGAIGRRILPELLAPEFSVRVITRNPGRLPQDIREQVELVQGSTDNVNDLLQALEGVDALFCCFPREPLYETNISGHYLRFARAAAQVIRETQTPRVINISADVEESARTLSAASALRATEKILNDSGAAVRHLRCGWLMENLLSQVGSISRDELITFPIPADTCIPMVAASDVADLALKLLVREDWTGAESISVGGSQAISLSRVASIIEEVLERPVRYEEAPAGEYVRTLVASGASAEYALAAVEIFSQLASANVGLETGIAHWATPTTLAGWVRSEFLPLFKQYNQRQKCRRPHHSRAMMSVGQPCWRDSHSKHAQTFESLLT